MNKLIVIAFALLLSVGMVLPAFADVQIDQGQMHGDQPYIFMVVRNGRQATFPNEVSKDKVVIWDSTSNDGVSITTTTTSYDARVAGVLMDTCPGSSRDNSAVRDVGYNNWARMQVWGRHVGVVGNGDTKHGTATAAAGDRVATSATAGAAGLFCTASADEILVGAAGQLAGAEGARYFANTSRDSFGVILGASSTTSWDVFIKTL